MNLTTATWRQLERAYNRAIESSNWARVDAITAEERRRDGPAGAVRLDAAYDAQQRASCWSDNCLSECAHDPHE